MPDTAPDIFQMVPPRVACAMLRMDHRTIKELAAKGLLDFIVTPRGHRRYAVHAYLLREIEKNRAKIAGAA
jgi:hypothetical protein